VLQQIISISFGRIPFGAPCCSFGPAAGNVLCIISSVFWSSLSFAPSNTPPSLWRLMPACRSLSRTSARFITVRSLGAVRWGWYVPRCLWLRPGARLFRDLVIPALGVCGSVPPADSLATQVLAACRVRLLMVCEFSTAFVTELLGGFILRVVHSQ